MDWGLTTLSDTIELLVSELVTNAVKATDRLIAPIRPPIRLRLSSDHKRVLIEVWDASPRPPHRIDTDEASESGRGLLLVEMLSSNWSWYFPPEWGGKVVWCEISVG